MTHRAPSSRHSVEPAQEWGQLSLFEDAIIAHTSTAKRTAPTTRYQGSELKLLPWIWHNVQHLEFKTVLDAFGGTASVSYMFKDKGKAVTYNDYLQFNFLVGKALIENTGVRVTHDDVRNIMTKHSHVEYRDFIANTFRDIFFTEEENAWLDIVCQNIPRLLNPYKEAMAYYALFQACIVKRPYNLFHRQNLYMRTAEVERSFGNKTTWDTSFEEHFQGFVAIANDAIFDSGIPCASLCHDALDVPGEYDLVYIDTPYINKQGVGVDYRDFYHFLEGMLDYDHWSERIDYRRKHRPLKRERSAWSDDKKTLAAFRELFQRYQNATLVVSYRSDGIPGEDQLTELMRQFKTDVTVARYGKYKYALSTNGGSKEILLIGTNLIQ